MNRVKVTEAMPALASSSSAARADRAVPETSNPDPSKISRASERAVVLPAPALPTTTSIRRPEVTKDPTMARCSSDSSGRRARTSVGPRQGDGSVRFVAAGPRHARGASPRWPGARSSCTAAPRPDPCRPSETASGRLKGVLDHGLDGVEMGAVDQPLGDGADDVAALEARVVGREPCGPEQCGRKQLARAIVEGHGSGRPEVGKEPVRVDAVLDGHEPPLGPQVDDVSVRARAVRLGCPGGQRRQFGVRPEVDPPWAKRYSSISARRVENRRSTEASTPSISAAPRRTGPKATPRDSTRPARSDAW